MKNIINADCIEAMRNMDEASVSAIITDPPYGLSFMGKEWDHGVPGVPFWTEALRVLKPGGHALIFGGTRTFHRLACAVEDAGFEIRDCLSWMYGQGFPKSLDVSKAIDRRRVEDLEPMRVVCRFLRAAMDAAELKSHDLAPLFECHPRLIDHWAARDTDSQPSLPTCEQWATLRGHGALALGSEMDAEVWRLNGRKGTPGENWSKHERVGEYESDTPGFVGHRFRAPVSKAAGITAPATDAAKLWHGYGTALKPAWEPIIVARKPLAGTVAANCQEHGTGALNVDGCRIESGSDYHDLHVTQGGNRQQAFGMKERKFEPGPGRWPANVVLDEEAGAMLDEQSGDRPGRSGASRFFYCAKASKRDRGEGNNHTTVKPVELMRWLVRLVSGPDPKTNLILDPFAGSGTTGVACKLEGVPFVLIEREAEYVKIIKNRLR